MSEGQTPVTVNVLYDGSELVEVQASSERKDIVTVIDRVSGHVMHLPIDDAWFLSDMVGQEVRRALTPPLTPEQEAPYTGPCPPWCECRGHGIFSADSDFHFARRGRVETTTIIPDFGEPACVGVEILQHVLDDPEPLVALEIEALDEGLRLTADEAEQVARRMLQTVAEIREFQARQQASRCELAPSAA